MLTHRLSFEAIDAAEVAAVADCIHISSCSNVYIYIYIPRVLPGGIDGSVCSSVAKQN